MERRQFLSGVAIASGAGVAGCLGDDDDVETLNMGAPPSGTATNEAMTQLQRAAAEESEEIQVQIEETGGHTESIQLFNDGEFDGHNGGLTQELNARNDEGPFTDNPVENFAQVAFTQSIYDHYWIAVDGSGIETFDDVVADDDIGVFMLPPAWGQRWLVEGVHENAGVLDELMEKNVDMGAGDVAGAIEEGRIDAVMAYGVNGEALPGWLTEVDARSDVYMVEPTDTYLEGIENTEGTEMTEFEPYAWDQDISAAEIPGFIEPFVTLFSEDVPNEAVYEACRVSHEHSDVIREAGDVFMDHSDIDVMADALPSLLDLHPGAVEFYEDHGVTPP